jgi:hypothetical protein
MFPLVRLVNGNPRHSYHRPIIVDVEGRERREWNGNLKFIPKFEDKWRKDGC